MTPQPTPPATESKLTWGVLTVVFGLAGGLFPPLWLVAVFCYIRYLNLICPPRA